MALNLSTLTSPATSGDVLAEALTTADFLEPVPVLRNLARGSQKGGDAKQGTALNQPKALPLIKNPQGNLGGYLYIPNVTGNYATGPSVTIGANQTWEAEVDMVITQFGTSSPFKYVIPFGTQGGWNSGIGFWIDHNANVVAWSKGRYTNTASGITLNTPFNIKYGFDGTNVFYKINDVAKGSVTGNDQSAVVTAVLQLNQQTSNRVGNYAIQKAKLTVNNAVVFDCDFNGSTSIRHGDTKFKAAVGGAVSLTRAGQDPITVVKKNILRFDGVNDGLRGVFANNINGGYMFAAFSVLGDGGESNGRVFSVDATGYFDYEANGAVFGYNASGNLTAFNVKSHTGMFDDANGDILQETKITNGSALSKVNNADAGTSSGFVINSSNFNVVTNTLGQNAAIDLEYLALFSASITDAQADSVRNYINNRNNVFSLVDNSYYFFNPQKADFTGNFTDANTLDGYITGSDLGDTDVRSNLTLVQATLNDQPSTDGYTITFNDAAEHLEFENGASQNLSGWQVCGTSLGTFAYRVQGAVTELNLLGNAGAIRSIGDLYGIILLPASATGKDIEDARKLLIDRGAADGAVSHFSHTWFGRGDIVEFKHIDASSVTTAQAGWLNNYSLKVLPALDLSNSNNFIQTWQNCSALTSFPAGANLGTAASNVNFTSAFQSSGLTSFPALDLSTGNNFRESFQSCTALTTIEDGILLGTSSSSVDFTSAFKACTALTTLPSNLDLSKGDDFQTAFQNCQSLVNFPANAFDTMGTPQSYCFLNTWLDNNALSAASVENILVSINTSGQSAPSTGPEITIKYNTATGSLSAATDSAITSLRGKSWVIYINGVERIP